MVAAGQIAVTVPVLLFGRDHSAPEHVAHEMGSFGIALAAGFLVAAWRPGRALGMRPVVGVAAVLLAVTAVADLAGGRTSLGDEAPHLLAIAGWLLIRHLAATCPPTMDGPAWSRVRSLVAALAGRGRGGMAAAGATAALPVTAAGLAAAGTSSGGHAAPSPAVAAGEMTRERAVG
jgi:hypothetical protein